MRVEDLVAVESLVAPGDWGHPTSWTGETWLETGRSPDRLLPMVVEADEVGRTRIIAAFCIRRSPWGGSPSSVALPNLIVLPSYRGQGYGRAIVGKVLSTLSADRPVLRSALPERCTEAHKFLAACGLTSRVHPTMPEVYLFEAQATAEQLAGQRGRRPAEVA